MSTDDLPVAIVTGASRGIGRAIACRLAKAGRRVVVGYRSRRDAAEAVVHEIESAGGSAIAVAADIGCREQHAALTEAGLGAWGRVDLLVNNAGIAPPSRCDLLELTEADWDTVFDTNLKGQFFLTQRVVRVMLELRRAGRIAGGKVINIASLSSFTSSPDRAAYCMSKAGLSMMTLLLADRFANEGIEVFEVCPGIIETDMTRGVHEKYDARIAEGLVPMRRWGQPDDVARAVEALATDALPYCTGQRLYVDGGFHLRRL